MYAVIRTGGKQYRVSEGDRLRIERIEAEAGSAVEFDQVLLVADGDDIRVGTPLLEGGRVQAEVTDVGKGDKVSVVKFKRRQNYRRMGGHRQPFTEVTIKGISAG